MTHMVIVNTAAEKSFHPCGGIDAAIATIERFRNEDNVESCELFELNPISFEFKPYYHVALSTGAGATSVAASAPIAEAPSVATPDLARNLTSLNEHPEPAAEPAVSVPVLSAVESPNPFDTATGTTAAADAPASLSDAFVAPAPEPAPAFEPASAVASPFGVADDGAFSETAVAPSALDATLADVGVSNNPPIPPLPEAIPPAPAFGEAIADPMSSAAVVDPFAQSPSEAAAVATGFDQVDESATSSVSDLFDAGTELPPPPPPPPLEGEMDEQPRRGLFGR